MQAKQYCATLNNKPYRGPESGLNPNMAGVIFKKLTDKLPTLYCGRVANDLPTWDEVRQMVVHRLTDEQRKDLARINEEWEEEKQNEAEVREALGNAVIEGAGVGTQHTTGSWDPFLEESDSPEEGESEMEENEGEEMPDSVNGRERVTK